MKRKITRLLALLLALGMLLTLAACGAGDKTPTNADPSDEGPILPENSDDPDVESDADEPAEQEPAKPVVPEKTAILVFGAL